MAETFLQQTASYLWQAHGAGLQDFCLVFPNKRAPLFFNKWLSQAAGKPVWAPAYRSIGQMMSELSGLRIADRLQSAAQLYRTWLTLSRSQKTFDEFYTLGELILNDFEEIDKQMAPAADLFRNMADLNAMQQDFSYLTPAQVDAVRQFWSSFGNPSDEQTVKHHFAGIWPLLDPLYRSFRGHMQRAGCGYEGMVYRAAAERLGQKAEPPLPHACYAFIGFHILTRSEQILFDRLKQSGKALFFWDYDELYIRQADHSAGRFIREYLKRYPMPETWPQDHLSRPKDWRIVAVPSETGQARMMGTLLDELAGTPGRDWSRTAVVLPDEHMLEPVLSSIPSSIGKINISMGYALSQTPVCGLFDSIFQLQRTARGTAKNPSFHHQAVTSLLSHPYIQALAPGALQAALRQMTAERLTHPTRNRISELLRTHLTGSPGLPVPAAELLPWLDSFFVLQPTEYAGYLESQTQSMALFMKQADERCGTHRFEHPVTFLYTAVTSLRKMMNALGDDIATDRDTFALLFRKYCRSLRIPFSGEPLEGLQVIGMLETRALDFDQIIILSMNEGVMPPSVQTASLIPYSFRTAFGLTTIERQDSLYAYLFYRLMQRAATIRCIWFTDNDKHSEKSRFLTQLQYGGQIETRTDAVTFSIKVHHDSPLSVARSRETEALLERFLSTSGGHDILSPSALNDYLSCRLKFWFKHLRRLKEPDEIPDETNSRIFGNIFHETMKLLYGANAASAGTGTSTTPEYGLLSKDRLLEISRNKPYIEQALNTAFSRCLFGDRPVGTDTFTGQTLAMREVLLKYVFQLLQVEASQWGAFTPVFLEHRISVDKPLAGRPGTSVRLGGYIDRMDWDGRAWRILDYKTGDDNRSCGRFDDLFNREKADRYAAVRQVLTYAHLVSHIPAYSPHSIIPGLIRLRDLFNGAPDFHLSIGRKPVGDYRELDESFAGCLQELLEELFCSDQAFNQTSDTRTCEYCSFRTICRRQASSSNDSD